MASHLISLALLVLSLAPRGFSPGTPVFPSPQKPTLPNSNSIGDARARLNEFILTVTEAWDKSEIACCACFLLRTKTLPRTQQLLRIFYGSHDGRTESSLVPLRFWRLLFLHCLAILRTFDKCISCVFKDYLFNWTMSRSPNTNKTEETVDAFPLC